MESITLSLFRRAPLMTGEGGSVNATRGRKRGCAQV